MKGVTTTIYLAPLGKPRSALCLRRQTYKYVLTQTSRPLPRPSAVGFNGRKERGWPKASSEGKDQERCGPLRGRQG